MSNIGVVLKEARSKKALSLDDVHAKTKIHPRVLQLLEEEKFEKLPSPLFAKSFLKSYADFLEVNSDALIESYEKEKQREPEQVLFIRPVDPSGSRAPLPRAGIIFGLAAVLFLSWIVLGHPSKVIGKWFSNKKTAQKAKPAEAKPKPAKAESAASKESEAAKEKEAEKKTAQPAEDKVLGPGDWLNTVKMGNFPPLPRRAPLELEMKALDAVWLHITTDGKVTFQGILPKGQTQTWKAAKNIEIWTGNAANMEIRLNKNPLGSPGKGVVKKMIISHEGIRIAEAFGVS